MSKKIANFQVNNYGGIEFDTNSAEWLVTGNENGVTIDCFPVTDTNHQIFFNQDQLKQLIEFLQTKLIDKPKCCPKGFCCDACRTVDTFK